MYTYLQARFYVIVLRYLRLLAMQLLLRSVTTDLFEDTDNLIIALSQWSNDNAA